MKAILASLCLLGNLLAAETLELAGVWVPVDKEIRCRCGHETQLHFIRAGDTSDYEVVEYCLGHKQAAALGEVKRSDTKLNFTALKNTVEYTISADRNSLTMTSGTLLKTQALVMKRIDGDAFGKPLAKIPSTELHLIRDSKLFPNPVEALENPFAVEVDAEQKDKEQPSAPSKPK